MKRVFKLLLIVLCLFLTPIKALANEKVNVHLFWGNGCPYCEDAKKFFDSIKDEYSEYFELKEYETYNNKNNKSLKAKVHAKFNMETSGVPFIVIGDKYFVGYSSASDEEIINTIMDQYENGSTDIVQSIIDGEEETDSKESTKKNLILTFFTVGAIGFVLLMNTSNKKKK